MTRTYIRLMILLFVMFFCKISKAQDFSQKDKQLHFAAGATFGSWCFVVGDFNKKSEWKPILYGIGGSTLAGAGKECYDKYSGGIFDTKDLAATVIGGVVSVSIIEGVRAIIKHKRSHKHHNYEKNP